jgi:hypothetical protein
MPDEKSQPKPAPSSPKPESGEQKPPAARPEESPPPEQPEVPYKEAEEKNLGDQLTEEAEKEQQ